MGAAKSACGKGCFEGLHGRPSKPPEAQWLDPSSDAYAAAAREAEPLRVAVVGAAGQIGYALAPMIASGEMFGRGQRVILQCLDLNLPQVLESLRGLEMELQDGDFPLLVEVICSTEEAKVFRDADYAILLGACPLVEGKDRREIMEKNTMIFRTMGHGLDEYAKKSCKVLVAAAPVCTNALLCAYYAPSLPKANFFALTRLEQNRVSGQLARRAATTSDEVSNAIIWGSSPLPRRPDLENCIVKGKHVFSTLHREEDRRWAQEELPGEVQHRGAAVARARKAACALSAARAIVGSLRDLHCGARSGCLSSLGVWSDGNPYGISSGLIFSMPVMCRGGGQWSLPEGLTIGKETRERIKEAERELDADRKLVRELGKKHGLLSHKLDAAAKDADRRAAA